jgi:diguanylate cyclase (GGDEF)-like protein/PAS domain S-box-containing protein
MESDFMRHRPVAKPQILVVDDDLLSLELLLTILAEEYTVLTAQNGQEALDLLSRVKPDLILLDIVMPGMDGYELFQRIRELPQCVSIPILFLTGMAEHECEVQGLKMGAADYITKPYNPHIVRLRVKNHLQMKHQMEQLTVISTEQRSTLHFLRLIADTVPDLIWSKDANGCYLFANRAICEKLLIASDTDEPIGKNDLFFAQRQRQMHTERDNWHTFGELCVNSDQTVLETLEPGRFDEYGNVQGSYLHLDVFKAPLLDEQGRLLGTVGCGRDVTRERQLEQEQGMIQKQLRLAYSVFKNSSEGIVVTDHEETILLVNQAFSEVTGYSTAEILGQTPRLLKSERHDPDFYQTMWRSLQETGQWRGEIWNRRKNGEIYPELLSVNAVRDGQGQVCNYVAVFTDISKMKYAEDQLEYLAWRDPLTDLPNRHMACSYLAQALGRAQRSGHLLALLCLGLDRFKDINDCFGHTTGDSLLHQVSLRLRERMRQADMVARLGSDEFIILLEDLTDYTRIGQVADDIIALLREPFVQEEGSELQIGTSIGIALFPHHGQTNMELLQRSEAALFQAKQQGRSCYAFYTEAMTHKAIERVQLGIRLRRAIELHELQVVYQPQTELESGAIVGAEALMRWQSRELGIISPARFIPLAEELGCIAEMGEWILREVCRQGRIWLDQGLRPVTLAVNLSPIQFQQEDIKQTVAGILAETCFPAELLELELTESALMQQGRRTIELLKNLRELGVRLALDDFGTGYSSLAYLKHFPLHLLKIDKSFIDEIHLDTKDMQLVSTIILMAKSMGFKVLAEGVELQQQLDTLKGLKCDLYQGYLKSKPLQPHEFAVLLAEQARKI